MYRRGTCVCSKEYLQSDTNAALLVDQSEVTTFIFNQSFQSFKDEVLARIRTL